MLERDYHGTSLRGALHDAESIIGAVRASGQEPLDVEFVTGFGVIRETLFDLLKNDYSLSPRYKVGNQGVISVTIE